MVNCIVVFLANVENWGAERSVCSLCKYLQDCGYKVIIVIPRSGPIIDLLNKNSLEYIIHFYSLSHYHIGHFPRFDKFIRCLLKKPYDVRKIIKEIRNRGYKPRLIYSASLPVDAGLICSRILKIPHVQHIRENMDAFGYKFLLGKKLYLKYSNRFSSLFICTCMSIQQLYAEYLDLSKTVVVHNGVPAINHLASKRVGEKLKIVQVGRFMQDKRIIDSLSAVKILVNKGIKSFMLDIYGNGKEFDLYQAYIDNNALSDYVELKGFSNKIDFAPYHVGLMTSKFEAFARSVLDYMNNGLAVIASNTGGNVEQVIDGETGLLYQTLSSEDLALKLESLILKPQLAINMGKRGRMRFLKMFTQERYLEKAAGIILPLMENE